MATEQELAEWAESGLYDRTDKAGHMADSAMTVDAWEELSKEKQDAYNKGYYHPE